MIDSATGEVAGAGTSDMCGAQVAVASINAAGGVLGRKLKLTIADDQSTPAVAAQQAQKLTAQGTRLFVGGSTSTDILAALPFFKATSSFFTGGTTKSSDVLDYDKLTVRVNSSSAQDMAWSAKYLDAHYSTGTLVMIGLAGTFTQGEFQDLTADVSHSHFTKIDAIYAPDTTTDWSSFISKIQAENPSVIVTAIYGTDQPVAWFRQALSAGLKVPEFGAPSILSSTVISEAGKAATSGLVSADSWVTYIKNASEQKLESNYQKYSASSSYCGKNPFAVEGKQMETTYSQVEVLAQGISSAKSTDPAAIRAAIIGKTIQLPSGAMTFDSTGQGSQTYYLYDVKNGNQVPLS
jgi:ABC-type branched-subunit amino acid transport system substrate-binding protein